MGGLVESYVTTDVAYNEERETLEEAVDGILYEDVDWRLVNQKGSGGWPEVEFSGPSEHVYLTIVALCGGDEEQASEIFWPSVLS